MAVQFGLGVSVALPGFDDGSVLYVMLVLQIGLH